MANTEHLAILKQGVKIWNRWRSQHPAIRPDFRSADLRGLNLEMAYLSESDLFHVNLDNASLRFASLDSANLIGASLAGVKLEKATLFGANLSGTLLTAADFSGAELLWTVLGSTDLSQVTGLEKVIHFGPSIIDCRTIYLSKGKISQVFLRGCGVPETFIEYSRSLIGKYIHYFTCMISYSSKDERFCKRFYENLRARDVQVWRFAEDAKLGEGVWQEIDKVINAYDKVIPVCSKNSLQSPKVLREIDRALEREDREKKNILFPITIDRYLFDEWEHPRKADVLAKVVGDFRGWNRSAAKYDAAFRKLLKALKAE